ncbi:MAG TPA: TIGR03118 family protein [Terriglobales bacterium]|nr:TIGR03118 family protein [Terriglobales bacterium]
MKKLALFLLGLLATSVVPPTVSAQQNAYMQTNLVANVAGVAKNTDPQLSNPWGISIIPGDPFWIANNNGGTSTLYDANGNKQSLVVGIPSASVNPCSPGCPTGTVGNTTGQFAGGLFIFDTEDGILANWTGANNAVVAVDNSPSNAVYKGLALLTNASGNFLLAANFRSGKIDVFDHNFQPASLSGSFTDPNLPAGMAPHGVHIINGQIYVAYAVQDSAKHDPTTGAGSGQVDIFDENGNFVKKFTAGGTLNAPWGVVATPATFGTFHDDILVGNFGDGTINAFDSNGKFLGQLMDTSGHVITNPGLWDMVFGQGGTGDPNTLYFTAGGANQTSGLFATLLPSSAATAGDFSLALSAQSATVSVGGSTSLSVSSSAVGGFNGPITLSCSGLPSGLNCNFSPDAITPGSSTSTSNLTVSAASTYMPFASAGTMGWLPFSGLGVVGMLFAGRRQKRTAKGRKWALGAGASLVLVLSLFAMGCGGGSSNSTRQNNSNTVTMMVTGTSGAIVHSVPVTLTIH